SGGISPFLGYAGDGGYSENDSNKKNNHQNVEQRYLDERPDVAGVFRAQQDTAALAHQDEAMPTDRGHRTCQGHQKERRIVDRARRAQGDGLVGRPDFLGRRAARLDHVEQGADAGLMERPRVKADRNEYENERWPGNADELEIMARDAREHFARRTEYRQLSHVAISPQTGGPQRRYRRFTLAAERAAANRSSVQKEGSIWTGDGTLPGGPTSSR